MSRIVVTCAALALLSACGGAPPVAQASSVDLVNAQSLPRPDDGYARSSSLSALGAYDKVSIEPFGMPDLLREVVVDAEGVISYPLAGRIQAAGLTTSQLADRIEDAMRANSVRDPRVSVNVVEIQSKQIAVDGEVGRPGLYPVTRELTLVEAIALAGGTSEFARTSDVIVFREVGGQQYAGLYNLEGIRRGNYPDPEVLPSDRVVVSASRTRALLDSLQGVTGLITTPLILLVRGT